MKRLVFKLFLMLLITITTVLSSTIEVQASSACDKYFTRFIASSKNALDINELESEFSGIKFGITKFLTNLKTSKLSFEKNIRQLVQHLLKLENFSNRLYILHENSKYNQLFATFMDDIARQKFEIMELIFLNPEVTSLIEEAFLKRFRSNLDFDTISYIQKLHSSLIYYNKLHDTSDNSLVYSKKISDIKQNISLPLSFSMLPYSEITGDSLPNFLKVFRKQINDLLYLERAYVKNETGARNLFDYTFKNSNLGSESAYNNIIQRTFPVAIWGINNRLKSTFSNLGITDSNKKTVSISTLRQEYESKKAATIKQLNSIFSQAPYRIKTSTAVYGILQMLAEMYQLSFIITPNNYSIHDVNNLFTVTVYNENEPPKYLGDIYINIKDLYKKSVLDLKTKVLNIEKISLDSDYAIKEKYFSTFINLKNLFSSVEESSEEYLAFDSLFDLVTNIHRSIFNLLSYHNPNTHESIHEGFYYLLDSYITNISFMPSFLRYYLVKEDGSAIEDEIINTVSDLYTTNFVDMFIYEFLSIEEYVFHYHPTFDENTYLDQVKDTMYDLLKIQGYPLYIEPDFNVLSEYIYNHQKIEAIGNSLKFIGSIEMLSLMNFLAANEFSTEAFNQVKLFLLDAGRSLHKFGGIAADGLYSFFDMSRGSK